MSKLKFWNFENSDEGRSLYFDGYIASESWYGDEITPKQFKDELNSSKGDLSVWINSPGGDVFAAASIYNMLKEYKGNIKIKIDSLAASAASVIAMAGDEILMSPVSNMMIHNPSTIIWGETKDFKSGIAMLDEIKQSIINAYEMKTGLNRKEISKMMDSETWFNAKKAVELGFADEVMYEKGKEATNAYMFDKVTVTNCLTNKLTKNKDKDPENKSGTDYKQLMKRLNLLEK